MIPIKTGKDHIESLRDGRNVYIYGTPVADVTDHKAFRNAIRTAAALYDFQAQPDVVDTLTFASPDTGRRINRCWQLPDSYTQLVERRRALEAWAELHFGFMGRSPDHVASCISGMFMGTANDTACLSSPGPSGWMQVKKTSFAIMLDVASILAPLMVRPSASSSTTEAARLGSAWAWTDFERSACGLMMT